jgi:hypothetical protein
VRRSDRGDQYALDAATQEKMMATSFWATRNAATVHLRAPPFLQMVVVVESPSIPGVEPGSDAN